LRAAGNPLASEGAASFSAHLEQELRNLHTVLDGLDISAIAESIAAARRVLVIGFRNSYPMALHLRQQLAQARDAVELAPLPGQSVGEELASLDEADVVVLVGFRRRPELFAKVVEAVAESPATSILITDAGGRKYASRVDHTIECTVDSVSAFDSYAAVASVMSLLASAVLQARLRAGRDRIARIGATYEELGELEV
jgi:DNA-binding MurR/RpiR family transcriptional regulator